jgi:ferredoxin-type protein NapH
MRRYKYLTARRFTQVSIMLLFFAGNAYGWTLLRGNLSYAKALDAVPFSDPFAALQGTAAGADISGDIVIGALLIILLYAVVGGRAFCGWVCPLNIVTDAANRLRRSAKLDTTPRPWAIKREARYWITAMTPVLSAIIGVAAFEWISPIGALHRGIIYGIGLGWAYVASVFLFDLFAVKNGFCGHLCPLGAFYSLIGRFGFLRIGYNRDKCTECMKCIDVCPEGQVLHMVGKESGLVRSGECLNCGRCIEVCDDNAVNFSNIYSKKAINKT